MIELEKMKAAIGTKKLFIDEKDPEILKEEERLQAALTEARHRKKLLKEKREEKRKQMLQTVGELAEAADILLLDRAILLGAFRHIRKVVDVADLATIEGWTQSGFGSGEESKEEKSNV